MTKFNLSEAISQAEDNFGMKSNNNDWFNIQEGENRVRILTPLVVFPQHYKPGGYCGPCLGQDICPGCKEETQINVKWLCWVLDRKDDVVKIAKLPHKVAKMLQALQNDPDYAFDEAPMPYDVKINAKNAGTKEVEYSVIPGRETDLEEKVLSEIKTQTDIEEIKTKMKEKKAKELGLIGDNNKLSTMDNEEIEYPEEEIGDIPF